MNRRGFLTQFGAAALWAVTPPLRGDLVSDTKIGMSTPADLQRNGVYVWVRSCADALEAFGWPVRVYPNSTVGGERERTFQTQMGLLNINATGGDEISRWSPLAAASARPFLVDTYAHAERMMTETPYIEHVSRDLRKHGLELVDQVFTASMVGLFTRGTPVRRIEDLRALRLRVLSEADFNLLRAWNARGVQVAWEEVAQALQTGIIDAYLNPPNIATMFGHGTVLDYFTDLRMGPAIRLIVASTRWLESLSPGEREQLDRAFEAARTANRQWARDNEAADRQRLEAAGIEWLSITPDERAGWLEASATIPPSHWEDAAVTAQFLEWIEATRGPDQ